MLACDIHHPMCVVSSTCVRSKMPISHYYSSAGEVCGAASIENDGKEGL